MKHKLFLIVLVLAALLYAGAACAETDPIVCDMEVSPSKLSAPGPVDVTITISNAGDTDMKDPLMLYNPTSGLVEDFGDQGAALLKAGEVKTWTGEWDVNQRTLENGALVFYVKYTRYREIGESYSQSQPIRGKLSLSDAEAGIEIKRTISPGTAREGQTVTVKYDIVNTGTVSLQEVTIKENKDINKEAQTIPELKPGETAQIKFPVTMGKKDLTSSATVTYKTPDSKKAKTETVEKQVITYGEPAMSAKLSSSVKGVAQGGTVTLTLELKNSGSVDYSDIRVTDPTLGDVFTNQKLEKKGTLKLEKEITLTETTEYQFTVTAIDNTGTEVSFATDALTLTAVDPNKALHLTLEAAADKTEVYADPGVVRFTLTVTNDSEVDAKDVEIYEALTRLYTFPSIPAGESRSMTRDAALSMTGKYQFSAKTVDDLGSSLTFDSNAIQIALSAPTPAPATQTPVPEPTAEPTFQPMTPVPINDGSVGAVPKVVRSVVYPVTILCLALLVGALALLAIATKKRMDQKKASDAAYDHLERAKRRDYIAPQEEEAPEQAKQPAETDAKDAPADGAAPEGDDDLVPPHMKYVRDAYERRDEYAKEAYGEPKAEDEPQAYPDDAMYGAAYDDPAYADDSAYADEDPVYADEGAQPQDEYAGAYDDSMFRRPAQEQPEESEPDAYAEPGDAGAEAGTYYEDEAGYEPAAEGDAYEAYESAPEEPIAPPKSKLPVSRINRRTHRG